MEKKGVLLKNEVEVSRLISDFYYKLPLSFDYEGESHDGWEFVYVENGRVRIGVGEESYILKKGEMVCHQPFEFHSIRPHEGEASVMIVCFECASEAMEYFKSKILSVSQRQKQYLNDIAAGGKAVFLPKDPLEIARDGAMDRSPEATVYQEQYVKCAIELLLLSLMKSSATEKQSRVSLYEHVSQREDLAEKMAAYLRENIARPVHLQELSDRFSYSLSSIKRIFKEVTGYSVMAYLNNLRLLRAKEMLAESDGTVESIAAALGYANIYYFSTSFKKKWGESPSHYRARQRAQRRGRRD